LLYGLGCPFRELVHGVDRGNPRVELEEVGKLAAKLAKSYYSH